MRHPDPGHRGRSHAARAGATILLALALAASSADPGEAARKKKRQKAAVAETADVAEVKIPPGPLNIVVSLKEQRLTVYASDGSAVASSPISSGRSGYATPMGVFSILEKNKDHVSNLYGASMPYMQRLTWSGIALHAGALPGYPASHGCIRLPHAFSKRLFSMTKMGARVIVTGDAASPKPVSHPSLFVPGPLEMEHLTFGAWRKSSGGGIIGAKTIPSEAIATEAVLFDKPAADPAPGTARPRAFPVAFASASAVDGEIIAARNAEALAKRSSPITVLVSRKLARLFVRRNGVILFEAPIAIVDPERPLGTHVLTATSFQSDGKGVSWMAVSIPSSEGKATKQRSAKKDRKGKRKAVEEIVVAIPSQGRLDAHAALDRIAFPEDASRRIAALLSPGSTVMISDNGISTETGKGTEFILLTR
jgi:lipoprotein-anchoring transpeptidase ErfK/SrfK